MPNLHGGRRNRVWPWWGWALVGISLGLATWSASDLSAPTPHERLAGAREVYRAPDLSATLRASSLPPQAQLGGQLWRATSALPHTESLQATLRPTGEILGGHAVLGGTLPDQERFVRAANGEVYVRYAPTAAAPAGGS